MSNIQKNLEPIDKHDTHSLFNDERLLTICPLLTNGLLCIGMIPNDENEIISLTLFFRNPYYKGQVSFTKNSNSTFNIIFEEGNKTIENVYSFDVVTVLIYEIKRVCICFN